MGQHRSADRPIAAVYRGPIASDGCAESLALLLRKCPARFQVHYLGPNETHDINEVTLSHLDLFAWPGGGGESMAVAVVPTWILGKGAGHAEDRQDVQGDDNWTLSLLVKRTGSTCSPEGGRCAILPGVNWNSMHPERQGARERDGQSETKLNHSDDQASDYAHLTHYTLHIQNFVRSGGLYAGFCLGAFFARGAGTSGDGKSEDEAFFGLLPPGSYVSSERFEPGAEVKGDEDAVVRTDWVYGSNAFKGKGTAKGSEVKGRWQ